MEFFNQFVDKGLRPFKQRIKLGFRSCYLHREAIKILEEHNDEFDYKVFWGCDLQTEHEAT